MRGAAVLPSRTRSATPWHGKRQVGQAASVVPGDERSDDAAALAASPAWADRVKAVAVLRDRRDEDALALWRRLLRDPSDTAPIQAAVEALVEDGDDVALDLLFEALADEPLEDEHLLLFIGWTAHLDRLLRAAPSRVDSRDGRLGCGAQRLIEWHAAHPSAGWKIAVEEVSAGVYRATARSGAGQLVERTGTDPDALRARVAADVAVLPTEPSP